jgi:type II secretory pathway pseudopilin PulG
MKYRVSAHYSACGRHCAVRPRAGQQLIELIFAVAITGFLAAIMSTSLSQTLASSVAAENRMTATHIAQELLDRIRDCPYSDLPTTGAYKIQVYSDDGITPQSNPPFAQYPLLMDVTSGNYTWSPGAQANRLMGTSPSPIPYATATVTFTPPVSPSTSIGVSINVSWTEGTANRSLVVTSTVSQYGMHN